LPDRCARDVCLLRRMRNDRIYVSRRKSATGTADKWKETRIRFAADASDGDAGKRRRLRGADREERIDGARRLPKQ
jgi:hypothetical protein